MSYGTIVKPSVKPVNPSFSCGPCAKHEGWSVDALKDACTGRSHRSQKAKARMHDVVALSRKLLDIPEDYLIAITPASDTGAIETALWNMAGAPGVGIDVFYWEHFGRIWAKDVADQLKIKDSRVLSYDFGETPDLTKVDADRDLVFVWNGTTSGVCVPHGDWLPTGGKGLRICDATSAAFAYELPWDKLDVVTWSWQKVMGSEAQHGMIALSPKAVERVKSYTPSWPMPKIYNLKKNGVFNEGYFSEVTNNTPSMLCVEDALDALKWIESVGGRSVLQKRIRQSSTHLQSWVEKTSWVSYLCEDPAFISHTSPCFKISAPDFDVLSKEDRWRFVDFMADLLEKEGAGYDIKCYASAPAGLRFWCGGTIDPDDIVRLLPWVDWAFDQAMVALKSGKIIS